MMATIQAGNLPTQYAVGWFTLGLINAGLAQGKGRSGLGWWVASLFLGPLATLLIVLRAGQGRDSEFSDFLDLDRVFVGRPMEQG